MGRQIKLETVMRGAFDVLVEKRLNRDGTRISRDDAARAVVAHARTLKGVTKDIDGTEFVDEAVDVTFLTDLLKPYIPDRKDPYGKDDDISFAAPPRPVSAQLSDLLALAAEAEPAATVSRSRSILAGTAAPATSDTRPAPASIGKGSIGPTGAQVLPPILRTGHAMAEIDAAARQQIAKAISTALAKSAAPVAKGLRITKIVKAGN